MKLSIIVPVYNVERYLERCISSIEHQDIDQQDYEVILVNDGSTDSSASIANNLSRRYPNVHVINQKNQGLSGARNTGIVQARGKYLMFIDSDDYIEHNCLHALIAQCEERDLDVCHFPLNVQKEDGSIVKDQFQSLQYNKIYSGKDILIDGTLIGSVCSNIIRRGIFVDNNLTFHVGITHEDVEFTTRMFCHVRRLMLYDASVYYYMYNDQSLSKDMSYEKANKYVCDSAIVARSVLNYIEQSIIDDSLRKIIIRRQKTGLAGLLINIMVNHDLPVSIVQNLFKTAIEHKVYPLKGDFLNWKIKLISLLLNNKQLYLFFYKIIY